MPSTEKTVVTKAILHTSGHCDEMSADSVVASVLDLQVRPVFVSAVQRSEHCPKSTHIMAHFESAAQVARE